MKKGNIKWSIYCLAAGIAFLYNDWILGYALNPHLSANRSLISELSATSQPYHEVFQTLDIIAGVITLACIGVIWHFTAHIADKRRWLLLLLFLVVGLDSIIDASLPIACAPSIDLSCNLLSTYSFITRAHLIESNIAGAIIALAPVVWWWLHRSNKHRHISLASVWFIVIETAVGIAALIVRFTHHGNYGGIQRIYQGALGVWLGLLIYSAIAVHLGANVTKRSRVKKAVLKTDDGVAAS